jgi:hypothetical protein
MNTEAADHTPSRVHRVAHKTNLPHGHIHCEDDAREGQMAARMGWHAAPSRIFACGRHRPHPSQYERDTGVQPFHSRHLRGGAPNAHRWPGCAWRRWRPDVEGGSQLERSTPSLSRCERGCGAHATGRYEPSPISHGRHRLNLGEACLSRAQVLWEGESGHASGGGLAKS